MKEIGEDLKEARENIGLSIEEVASDLKLRPTQIENIEAGNADAFKDIFYLKYLIRDYSKYLGLSCEDKVDEFNEYLFDHTSRISIDDIRKAKKKADKKDKNNSRVASPYTVEKKERFKLNKKTLPILVVVFILLLSLLVSNILKEDDNSNKTEKVEVIK